MNWAAKFLRTIDFDEIKDEIKMDAAHFIGSQFTEHLDLDQFVKEMILEVKSQIRDRFTAELDHALDKIFKDEGDT